MQWTTASIFMRAASRSGGTRQMPGSIQVEKRRTLVRARSGIDLLSLSTAAENSNTMNRQSFLSLTLSQSQSHPLCGGSSLHFLNFLHSLQSSLSSQFSSPHRLTETSSSALLCFAHCLTHSLCRLPPPSLFSSFRPHPAPMDFSRKMSSMRKTIHI